MSSTYAWLYDRSEGIYYAVLPTDTSYTEKRNKYDKRIFYQIKVKKSQTFVRR